MNIIKFIWAIRALIYKLTFKKLGNKSYVGRPCYIAGRRKISIGKKNRIFPGIRLEAINKGEIVIEDDCAIQQNCHIVSKDEILLIGKSTTIAPHVFITNVDHMYENVDLGIMHQGYITKKTVIGEGCFIGFGASIQAGTILGKHCVVGARSVVRGIFPDYCVIVGVPGKIIKKYNMETKKWEKV